MDKSGRAASSRNRSGSGRHRFLPLLVVVLLAGIAGWFWLAGEPEFRERLSARLRGLEELAIGLVTDVHDKLNGSLLRLKSGLRRVTACPEHRRIATIPSRRPRTWSGPWPKL